MYTATVRKKTQQENILKNTPIGSRKTTYGKYPVIFLGYEDDFYSRDQSSGWAREHRYLMEKQLGRKLKKGEVVHHIDGDKTNNDLSNLHLMSVQEHNKCHATSERIIFELVKKGVVLFNRNNNSYELNIE